MALYVERPPNPPPGADWSYEVPGQYLEDIVSVSATLTTAQGPGGGVAHDSSGNGNDGSYFGPITEGVSGLVTGDAAVGFFISGETGFERILLPTTAWDPTGEVTFAWWMQTNRENVVMYSQGDYEIRATCAGGSFVSVNRGGYVSGLVPYTFSAPALSTHMVAFRLTATDWFFYIDGVLMVTEPFTGTSTNPPVAPFPAVGSSANSNLTPDTQGVVDELAIWSNDVSPAVIADLYAAGLAGFADWTATVLSQTPTSFYHLDDATLPAQGRTPSLVVTDGTHEVGAYAGSFPAPPTALTFEYSWIVGLSNNSQIGTQTTTTVGLPSLVLPAGYTLGTSTPDLGVFDQWSDITIWWNDDKMQAPGNRAPYAYPPGAMLVYSPPVRS